MKVLILGGTGAMGEYLVPMLAASKQCEQIYVTSRSQHADEGCIHYIKGNAHELSFLRDTLRSASYDVVIDFMNWASYEFEDSCKLLLDSTKHYVFLSSCRVCDDSETPITELTPRLLETTTDEAFLGSYRYALRKARQEDTLKRIGSELNKENYTIVRPYKSYSDQRLQLGMYEKENWLFRAVQGKPIIIKGVILNKYTSMTYAKDVAYGIERILMNSKAYGETIHFATSESLSWRSILKIYLDELEITLGKRPQVLSYDFDEFIDNSFEGGYQTKYDIEWDRRFDSSKADSIIGGEGIHYSSTKETLAQQLREFIEKGSRFLTINNELEEHFDKLVKEGKLNSITI